MSIMENSLECNHCGAEYMVHYDEDQFGLEEGDPLFCPFCGTENSMVYDSENQPIDDLDFED